MSEILLDFAHRLADEARKITLPLFRNIDKIDNKSETGFDPVTQADRDTEAVIRRLIETHYPDHAIMGEEYGYKAGNAYEWIIDPIDGTRAFLAGFPTWGTLIGLKYNGKPLLGIMDQPFTGERFSGYQQDALWHKGTDKKNIAVRACKNINQAIIATTAPEYWQKGKLRLVWDEITQSAQLLRYGADCYAYALLCAGHIDAVIETELQSYDICPLIPLIEAAGGIVTSWAGGDGANGGAILACGDKILHTQLSTHLKNCV